MWYVYWVKPQNFQLPLLSPSPLTHDSSMSRQTRNAIPLPFTLDLNTSMHSNPNWRQVNWTTPRLQHWNRPRLGWTCAAINKKQAAEAGGFFSKKKLMSCCSHNLMNRRFSAANLIFHSHQDVLGQRTKGTSKPIPSTWTIFCCSPLNTSYRLLPLWIPKIIRDTKKHFSSSSYNVQFDQQLKVVNLKKSS